MDIYFHHSWVVYSGVELLGHFVTLSLAFWRTARLFCQGVTSFFISSQQCMRFPIFLHPLQLLLFSDMNWYLVVLSYYSLMTNDLGHHQRFSCASGWTFLRKLFVISLLKTFPKLHHCPWNKFQTPLIARKPLAVFRASSSYSHLPSAHWFSGPILITPAFQPAQSSPSQWHTILFISPSCLAISFTSSSRT